MLSEDIVKTQCEERRRKIVSAEVEKNTVLLLVDDAKQLCARRVIPVGCNGIETMRVNSPYDGQQAASYGL
jgi:hypothetical protein